MPVTKKYYPNGVAHPAVYSNALLPVMEKCVVEHAGLHAWRGDREVYHVLSDLLVLDPFAGTGRIHELPFETVGVEIEPEWAELHPDTIVGNALDLPFRDHTFDVICTSPCYGNRMADHHTAKDASVRRSYTHDLGRKLHWENAGQLHWGEKYRDFHVTAWTEAIRVLRPGGLFVLNCKDHFRGGQRQKVCAWHLSALRRLGLTRLESVRVGTPSMRAGANASLRLHEMIYVLKRT